MIGQENMGLKEIDEVQTVGHTCDVKRDNEKKSHLGRQKRPCDIS